MTLRSSAFVVLSLLPACYDKTLSYGPDCAAQDGCGSTGAADDGSGSGSGAGSTGEGGLDPGPDDDAAPDPSAGDDSGVSITGVVDESSGTSDGASTDEGDDATSTTGEPTDDMYAPCTADEECTGGFCVHGFCSAVCWSQVDGETPCPPPPSGAEGVTIECGTIGFPQQNFCEGCIDCAQYCIASCWDDSTCPNGGSCVGNLCAPGGAYCGS